MVGVPHTVVIEATAATNCPSVRLGHTDPLSHRLWFRGFRVKCTASIGTWVA
jgi:hypothetical protein